MTSEKQLMKEKILTQFSTENRKGTSLSTVNNYIKKDQEVYGSKNDNEEIKIHHESIGSRNELKDKDVFPN